MKKLAILLQLVGLIASFPVYVALEMTHGVTRTSDMAPDSMMKMKTEITNTRISPDSVNKIQNTVFEPVKK